MPVFLRRGRRLWLFFHDGNWPAKILERESMNHVGMDLSMTACREDHTCIAFKITMGHHYHVSCNLEDFNGKNEEGAPSERD